MASEDAFPICGPDVGGCSPPHLSETDQIPVILPTPPKKSKYEPKVENLPLKTINLGDISRLPEFRNWLPLPPELVETTAATPIPKSVRPISQRAGHRRGGHQRHGHCPVDSTYHLPNGWRKLCTQRKRGATAGGWDVYLLPPIGRKLRSNNDILRFMQEHPDLPIDTDYVNMERPIDQTGRTPLSQKVTSLKEAVRTIKATGQLPQTLFPSACKVTKSYARVHHPPDTSPLKMKPKSPMNQSQVIQLETYFGQCCQVPTTDQTSEWAAELNLNEEDVTMWFKSKWKAKLEYEASVINKSSSMCLKQRKPVKFDIVEDVLPFSEPVTDDANEHFVIEYDIDAEEDDSDQEYNNDLDEVICIDDDFTVLDDLS